MTDRFTIPIECRADESREAPGRIVGTILETGRVAADRREVFTAGSADLPKYGHIATPRASWRSDLDV